MTQFCHGIALGWLGIKAGWKINKKIKITKKGS